MNSSPLENYEINKSEPETNLEVVSNNSDQLNPVFEQLNNSDVIKNHMKLLRINEIKDIKENEMKSKTENSEQIIDHNSKTIMEPVIHTLELNPNPMYESNKNNKIECPIYTLSNNEIKEDKMTKKEINKSEPVIREESENVTFEDKITTISAEHPFLNVVDSTINRSIKSMSQGEIMEEILKQLTPLDFNKLLIEEIYESLNKGNNSSLPSITFEEMAGIVGEVPVEERHILFFFTRELLRVAEKNGYDFGYNNNKIFLFNREYWITIEKNVLKNFLGKVANAMGIPKTKAHYYKFKDQLLNQFYDSFYLETPENHNDNVLINLKNGTFVINQNGIESKSFDKVDFIKYQLPFNFDPIAKAPLFEDFLNRVLPDIQSQTILAEYIAYLFLKHESSLFCFEKVLLLYGSGANGKSVFYNIIQALIGRHNISNYSLQHLTNENGYYRAKIGDTLLNYASEINGKVEPSIFKLLASGEPIVARLPYTDPFILTQYAKLIFNCNELPRDIENTEAFFRRFIIIPFDVTIPKNEQDKQLSSKIIKSELSGVFNWVLKGLSRILTQNGFSECETAENALECYKTDSNSVLQFLEENNYQKSFKDYVLFKNLYFEYKDYCMEIGKMPMNKPNFRRQLEMSRFEFKRKGGTGENIVYLKQSIDNPNNGN
ncbi:MAG: DNA primase [Bacteroidetes bacterium]|nr:DNA primase [Bacteroidota bacterium]